MSDNSAIEWTDRTWNVVSGCTRVSAGCDHCYIERTPPFRMAGRRFDGDGPGSTTGVVLHPDRLGQPLKVRKPQRWFVNSLADLFHEQVSDEYIASVFAVMALAPRHTFQVLTKRHARMRSLLSSDRFLSLTTRHATERVVERPITSAVEERLDAAGWTVDVLHSSGEQWAPPYPLSNVWGGVSVEDQGWAEKRIPALVDTPLGARFLSCEPLLGPVDVTPWLPYIDWVIVGGESGPGARPMHPQWARDIRDQCVAAGVPFHFKQWGEHVVEDQSPQDITLPSSCHLTYGNPGPCFYRVGKQAAGRELDGRTWDQYPEAAGAVVL